MSDIEYWGGLEQEIEEVASEWAAALNTVEDFAQGYVPCQSIFEGYGIKWSAFKQAIHGYISEWVGLEGLTEGIEEKWNEVLCSIVDKHIDEWVGSSINVEDFFKKYISCQVIVEELLYKWFGSNAIVEEVKNKWLGSSINIEDFLKKYTGCQVIVEQYINKYVGNQVIVEDYIRKYINNQATVEDSQKRWCGLSVFVRPAIYFNPVEGNYTDWINVDVIVELAPIDIRVTLDTVLPDIESAKYSYETILIRRPKRIWVRAWYVDGYVIDNHADYYVPVGGYIISYDEKEIVSIEEDVLWKE